MSSRWQQYWQQPIRWPPFSWPCWFGSSWLVASAGASGGAAPLDRESRRQYGTKGCKGEANAQPMGVRGGPCHFGDGTRARQSSCLKELHEVILRGRPAPSGGKVRRVLEPAEERDQRLTGGGRRVHDGALAGVCVDLSGSLHPSSRSGTTSTGTRGRGPAAQARTGAGRPHPGLRLRRGGGPSPPGWHRWTRPGAGSSRPRCRSTRVWSGPTVR